MHLARFGGNCARGDQRRIAMIGTDIPKHVRGLNQGREGVKPFRFIVACGDALSAGGNTPFPATIRSRLNRHGDPTDRQRDKMSD